jgi:uncharacterized NAD(P)/FAD-binding protein YdhS
MGVTRIGMVGGGATALYLLKELLGTQQPCSIVVYEASPVLGPGMPYAEEINADYMLCNAFSREIPVITQSLVQWLNTLPAAELAEWGLSGKDVQSRAFYPRVLIGKFLQNEFLQLVRSASENVEIDMRCNTRVMNVGISPDGKAFVQTASNDKIENFDYLVMATGHDWPSQPKISDISLLSPWPYTRVTELREDTVGILGSSLSAIDIVVALGFARGKFTEESGVVSWIPNDDRRDFKAVMISKMGIMPEGDFYYAYPYEPLNVITAYAVKREVDQGSAGLLHRVFNLLLMELDLADTNYLKDLGEDSHTIEGFCRAYFQRRKLLGGLTAVKKDFAEVCRSLREQQTIPHRYVLLRAHEVFDLCLRALDTDDWKLFSDTLLAVFADCYAAVPHRSLARIIAMFDAGVLSLVDAGDNAKFAQMPNGAIEIDAEMEQLRVDVLIDARGQAPAKLADLPFPALVKVLKSPQEPIQEPFKLDLVSGSGATIYCVAIPQLLQKYPFSQGLQNCSEVAKIVVKDIVKLNVEAGSAFPSMPQTAQRDEERALNVQSFG